FRPNDGPIPWWIVSKDRRVPGASALSHMALTRLLMGRASDTVADRIATSGLLWDRLLDPVLRAALNTAPAEGSAKLAAAVIRESLARGGRAARPRIAEPTLAAAFVDPALAWLAKRGCFLAAGRRLRAVRFAGDVIDSLDFGEGEVAVPPDEPVIFAVPPWVAATLVPGLTTPCEFRAIVNAHFAIAPPPGTPAMIGVIGGMAEWIFAFPDRISVTVSAADHLIDTDRAELAAGFWAEIAAIHDLPTDLPPWQIVKEKRATFAATPEQDARRPPAATRWRNLFLAGDWTRTGLPATIEGALRSGATAARLASAAAVV
ncbi:MAG: FAD-dependent oxidoreductase, partial [Sphingomonadaceae bacterium]|nr:FAD-dependent oxidoreductase [Sphingomonadaceae bacterium]